MRTYLQLPVPKSLPGFTLWKGLKSGPAHTKPEFKTI